MALAAFAALAIPATASATNKGQLTENNMPLAPGVKIQATNVGETKLFETGGSTAVLSCTTSTITGTLIKNTDGIEVTIETAKFGGTGQTIAGEPEPECTGLFNAGVTPLGLHWCLRSTTTMATDEFRVGSGACPNTNKIKFLLQRTKATGGIEECEYESTESIKGTGTTGTDIIHVGRTPHNTNGFTRIKGVFPCPASSEIEMTYTIETESPGGPVTISEQLVE